MSEAREHVPRASWELNSLDGRNALQATLAQMCFPSCSPHFAMERWVQEGWADAYATWEQHNEVPVVHRHELSDVLEAIRACRRVA